MVLLTQHKRIYQVRLSTKKIYLVFLSQGVVSYIRRNLYEKLLSLIFIILFSAKSELRHYHITQKAKSSFKTTYIESGYKIEYVNTVHERRRKREKKNYSIYKKHIYISILNIKTQKMLCKRTKRIATSQFPVEEKDNFQSTSQLSVEGKDSLFPLSFHEFVRAHEVGSDW